MGRDLPITLKYVNTLALGTIVLHGEGFSNYQGRVLSFHLKFCTEHGSDSAIRNDLTTEIYVIDERDFP